MKSVIPHKTLLLFLAVWLALPRQVSAQSGVKDSAIQFTFVGMNFGLYMPGGDLADRFGNNTMIGFDLTRKTKKNLIYSISGGFIFGNDVKEPGLMSQITTSTGFVIGADGLLADVRVYERGYQFSANIGKIFPVSQINPNSGIMVMAGPGFMQHKIRIESIGNTTPQLEDDYRKGYDRLSNGWELHEFVGFVSFGSRQLVNFYGGFEFIQAFTENRRSYNFDNPSLNGQNRVDLMMGFKVGWIIPFYKKKPKDFYYY